MNKGTGDGAIPTILVFLAPPTAMLVRAVDRGWEWERVTAVHRAETQLHGGFAGERGEIEVYKCGKEADHQDQSPQHNQKASPSVSKG